MTTITDKELIKEIKERIGSLDVRDNIERRAYEIALASLEAEPIAMVVPDEMDLLTCHLDGVTKTYAEGWNACRAAMLQSGNFRENKNSSTNNFREIAETSTNSPVIPGEVLSAILKFARVRADFDDFDGDRRGIGDCLDEAEQELIVTINKYASQLAVEPVVPDDVLEQTVASPAPGNQVSELTMWVKRLAHCLKYANSLSSLPDKAMEYLNQNGLISAEDIMR
ncbi:hypothetical protein EYE99_005053 [Escherichia coli]|nr:hypothetical protein [Escherichia coli]